MGAEIPCAYCGVVKSYPAEFPSIIYAKCTECTEADKKEEADRKAKMWHNRFITFLRKYLGEEDKMAIGYKPPPKKSRRPNKPTPAPPPKKEV